MAVQSTLNPNILEKLTAHIATIRQRLRRTSRTARLAAVLFLTLSIVGSGYGGYKRWDERRKENAKGRRLLRKNSGLRGKDGSRIIFVQRGSGGISKVVSNSIEGTRTI